MKLTLIKSFVVVVVGSAANAQVLIDEHFDTTVGPLIAPQWACDAPLSVTGSWKLANYRGDFQATATNVLELAGGEARLSCFDNSAAGGYPVFLSPD